MINESESVVAQEIGEECSRSRSEKGSIYRVLKIGKKRIAVALLAQSCESQGLE